MKKRFSRREFFGTKRIYRGKMNFLIKRRHLRIIMYHISIVQVKIYKKRPKTHAHRLKNEKTRRYFNRIIFSIQASPYRRTIRRKMSSGENVSFALDNLTCINRSSKNIQILAGHRCVGIARKTS